MEGTLRCSRCGSMESPTIRYVACAAITHVQTNYPVVTWENRKDDIRLWRVALCKACLPAGYGLYLKEDLKKAKASVGWLSFLLVVSFLAIYFNIIGHSTNFLWDPVRWILAAAVSIALFAGVFGAPFFAVRWFLDIRRLERYERTGKVPQKRLDEAFMGEALRISRQALLDDKVIGAFPLPKHQPANVPPEKKDVSLVTRKKEIIAVAETAEELERGLPGDWKTLWEAHKKETGEDPAQARLF